MPEPSTSPLDLLREFDAYPVATLALSLPGMRRVVWVIVVRS